MPTTPDRGRLLPAESHPWTYDSGIYPQHSPQAVNDVLWHDLSRLDPSAAAKIQRDAESGCWLWQGAIAGGGYGYITRRAVTRRAHRYIYELFCGPIAAGLHLDHLCRRRACVYVLHVEPVTPAENTRRGHGHGSETHCPQGHAYDGDNLALHEGRRICRTCRTARARAWRTARRQAVPA